MTSTINVARWLRRSRANGPGERFVLWVQGCGLACDGCWNPDTWSFAPRRVVSSSDLLAELDESGPLEGVTLSGGEPFAQAAALIPFVEGVRSRGLSVLVFTGFTPDELRSESARRLLEHVDVLVAGRYDRTRRADGQPLIGSTNQQVIVRTSRYSGDDLQSIALAEAHIDADGSVSWTGFPNDMF